MSMSFRERKACDAMKAAREFIESLPNQNIPTVHGQWSVVKQLNEALDNYFGSDRVQS
jgi:hypothetical protein